MAQSGSSELSLESAEEVRPREAPVHDPLSGKERAGVSLTWGVLALIVLFIGVMLYFMWSREAELGKLIGGAIHPTGATASDTLSFRLLASERDSYREFWFRLIQLVLLNVLLPVLTALLGYVFGTQSRPTRPD